jgi:Tfp pilus assembly protein PilV
MKLPIRNESAKNSQEGFSVVEVFLLVLVIIFLGITGGVVYHYNHKSTDSTTNNQSSSTSPNVINQPIDILYLRDGTKWLR